MNNSNQLYLARKEKKSSNAYQLKKPMAKEFQFRILSELRTNNYTPQRVPHNGNRSKIAKPLL